MPDCVGNGVRIAKIGGRTGQAGRKKSGRITPPGSSIESFAGVSGERGAAQEGLAAAGYRVQLRES
ncbi:hypothetical protein BDP81DRAFT_428600 [Colletotrichum phormii]|uniref:Uncharacterized protein n=1 Tax=Colletotrichum phormii TaxID=359342 RepID=A0AAJ0EEC8_9PEZI|nr:uncharacterized protein BDP81DRAFT_428600 [Colletotrichum phormii]KAK1636907.1 hypothetical protein BDP81DRAFT_428600 [Colletotrichum phormii]